jgi:predicted HicB family RNase H-like nuclease
MTQGAAQDSRHVIEHTQQVKGMCPRKKFRKHGLRRSGSRSHREYTTTCRRRRQVPRGRAQARDRGCDRKGPPTWAAR